MEASHGLQLAREPVHYDGAKMGLRALGHEGSAQEPLVLLHPFGLCSKVWASVMPQLRQHHRVFALAIPGHSGSESLPPDYRHTIDECVAALERKLDHLSIRRAHLVGSSLGGWLAIELARKHRALSVVALAPGGGWEVGSPEQKRIQRRFRVVAALLRVAGPVAPELLQSDLARQYLLRDAVAQPAQLGVQQASVLVDALLRCEAYMDIVRALPRQEPAAPFETLPCPVRVIWGARDRVLPMPNYSQRWQRVLPGAEWLVLPEAGHLPMLDDPDRVARAILELTRRPRSGGWSVRKAAWASGR
jgi:pimeloyl-ACP methyl ester carboxylesterase